MEGVARLEGVGLGLRWEFLDEVVERLDRGEGAGVSFFEVAPENFMRRGGYVVHALARVAREVPLVTHGLTLDVGGLEPFDVDYLAELGRFVAKVGAPFHSDHLCFGGFGGTLVHDLLPLPLTREAAAHAARRAREAAASLGVPFALENVTRYVVPGAAEMDEADFIREVLDQSGASLLLDVNNAWVNAENEATDARAFVGRLPLDRVAAIHVAGHARSESEGLLIDTHGADVADPVLDLLAWTMERVGPVPVLLERDHGIPEYDALLEEVGRVRRAVERGLAKRARSDLRPAEVR